MSTEIDQLSDILLVLDMEEKKIQAVKNIRKNGKLNTVDADEKNQNQFMRVDKSGDVFSNFFRNFLSQVKNPTRFKFFKVPMNKAVDVANRMKQHLVQATKEGEKLMKDFLVDVKSLTDKKQENKNDMATTENAPDAGEYRYKPEEIDWQTLTDLGLSKERLEKLGHLEGMLKGFKTNDVVPVTVNLGTAVVRTEGRLSLQRDESSGKVRTMVNCVRKEPQLNQEFFGHVFSPEDKENLLRTGNMGRIVNVKQYKTGELVPSVISVDRLTNELISLPADKIKIPEEIKGVKVEYTQKLALMEGKAVLIEGMTSKKGEPFDAYVQFNADKRFVEFLFGDRSPKQEVQQTFTGEVPRVIRGKKLTDKQYEKYKKGEAVYLTGIKGSKDNTYAGYFTLNKQTGKEDFSFGNESKMREKLSGANAKESTSRGTTRQSNKPAKNAPAKGKGRKM